MKGGESMRLGKYRFYYTVKIVIDGSNSKSQFETLESAMSWAHTIDNVLDPLGIKYRCDLLVESYDDSYDPPEHSVAVILKIK